LFPPVPLRGIELAFPQPATAVARAMPPNRAKNANLLAAAIRIFLSFRDR
jgi:hypothetical protein